ncbi:glycosyltransferase family 2 protein [Lactobacillus gallinarum]|uniref:glycosyltransferase family 2 protein n=1 Tax=Lactobacillus gallinarum TaxID=52242 RepID=UPI00195ECD31|nr:glycosyltransferase family A protein [Lactobacillus gallinarum]MBM6973420.1 glycosyltransferase family 2 protein [Lactobacillus gallinarum]
MSSFKISIIIPAFNEENNIRRILECACKQTYKEFEVIVVDDGSKDRTSEIAKTYAKQYSNFIYVHKENSGVSDTRNLGLKFVTGDYVCFWDADDWVESNYLENMFQQIHLTPCPQKTILVSGCTIDYYVENKKESAGVIKQANKLISKQALLKSFINEHEMFRLELWNKLFPAAIVKGKRFDSQFILGEDFEFFTKCLKDVDYLLTVNDSSYHYVIDITQMKHYTRFENEVKREKMISRNLIDMGISSNDVKFFYSRRLLITAYTALSFLDFDKRENEEEITFILKELKNEISKKFKPFGKYKKAQMIMMMLTNFQSVFLTKKYFVFKRNIKNRKK